MDQKGTKKQKIPMISKHFEETIDRSQILKKNLNQTEPNKPPDTPK